MNETKTDKYSCGPCWQNPFAFRNGFRQPKTSKHRRKKQQRRRDD